MIAASAPGSRLRIGLLSRGVYPRLVGGREVFIRALTESLARKGHDVVLVTENGVGETIPGVKEVTLSTPGIATLDLLAYTLAFAREGVRRLREVDVIHVHSPGANIALGVWAARILGVPVVVTIHSMAAAAPRWMWSIRCADALVAVSPSLKRSLEAKGVPSERIWMIPAASPPPPVSMSRGAERERLGLAPDDVVFIYHGRLVEGKGLEQLTKAFASLTNPRAKLVVVGDGPLRGELVNRLRASIERKTARLVGRVPHDQVWSYLCAADVSVLPSRSEGSPLALFEAMAMGVPVLAADAPGLRDFVRDGDNGIVIPRELEDGLQRAMEHVLQDDALRKRLSDGARQSAQQHSLEECAARHLELYRSLVAR